MSSGELQRLLIALDRAEQGGRQADARALRLQVVDFRLEERLRLPDTKVLPGDVLILDRLAEDARHVGLYEASLELLAAGRSLARRLDNELLRCRVELHAVQSELCLAAFQDAAELLRSVLKLPPQIPLEDVTADTAADHLMRDAPGDEPAALRVEALATLGRLRAALGFLESAGRAFDAALVLSRDVRQPWLPPEEIALAAGEALLDRGAFPELARLRGTWSRSDSTRAARWLALEGSERHLQADYTSAEGCLRKALEDGLDPVDRTAARWELVQVLVTLNRAGDARREIDDLAGELSPNDAALLHRLLKARWNATILALEPLPVPRQSLEPPSSAAPARPVVSAEARANGNGSRPAALPPRQHERLRNDWSRVANAVLVAADEGRLADALEGIAALDIWLGFAQSPFLAARFDLLAGIVALRAGDPVAAAARADAAVGAFSTMGMPADAWAGSRVRLWALRAAGRPAEERRAEAARADALYAEVARGLSAADRAFHQLNKWSATDETTALRLDGLRRQLALPTNVGRRRRALVQDALGEIGSLRQWSSWQSHPAGVKRGAAVPVPLPLPDTLEGAGERITRRARMLRAVDQPAGFWLPADVALLYYVVLPSRLDLFLVHRGSAEMLETSDATRVELFRAVADALALMRKAGSWRQVEAPLGRLSELLGMPDVLARLPAACRRLVIIPDDTLVHAPFAALPWNGKPLLERLTPALALAPRWARRRNGSPLRALHALGVGVTGSPLEPAYPPLPDPAKELGALHAVSRAPVALKDSAATIAAVSGELNRADLAHFVCHGEYNSKDPLGSGLLLGDGWLQVRDVEQLDCRRLRAAVLGACWGSNAVVLPGRDYIGLPAAFIEGGAESVLGAVWDVPETLTFRGRDWSTADLMIDLYREMATTDLPEALARVQRRLWRDTPPWHWGGYVPFVAGTAPAWPLRWLRTVIHRG